ncbi:MAG: hypothetical protein KF724_12615 [Phycisphaeraceae bacterium]|nr:hypothetical protein [Phycisphaeraceae bacterium]
MRRASAWLTLEPWRALWQLARLAWAVRFRLNGPYLRWRRETAFGHDPSKWPSPAERRAAVLRYGAWMSQMKRLGR